MIKQKSLETLNKVCLENQKCTADGHQAPTKQCHNHRLKYFIKILDQPEFQFMFFSVFLFKSINKIDCYRFDVACNSTKLMRCSNVFNRFPFFLQHLFTWFRISLDVLVTIKKCMTLQMPSKATHAPNRKPNITIIYWRVNAQRYPFGVFQSNGYL